VLKVEIIKLNVGEFLTKRFVWN